MTEKQFTDLTREDLIESITDMYDPNVLQVENIIGLMDKSNGELELNLCALKIREGKHQIAKFDWEYYNENNKEDLNWEQVDKEVFRQHIHDDLSTLTLNELRMKYQATRLVRELGFRNNDKKKKLDRMFELTGRIKVELFKRTTRKFDILQSHSYFGTVEEKLDVAFIAEHNIDPNISIYRGNLGILLAIEVDKEEGRIETLAYSDHEYFSIFKKGESESGLKAAIKLLTKMIFEEEE